MCYNACGTVTSCWVSNVQNDVTARQLSLSIMYVHISNWWLYYNSADTGTLRVAKVSCAVLFDAGVMTVQSRGLGVSILAELSCDHRQHVPSHCHAATVQHAKLPLHAERLLDSKYYIVSHHNNNISMASAFSLPLFQDTVFGNKLHGYLQTGCPSYHPPNSVKALKVIPSTDLNHSPHPFFIYHWT